MTLKPEHVIPRFPDGDNDVMVCGAVTGPTIPPSTAWVEWIEAFFSLFGEKPLLGSATFTNDFSRKSPGTGGYFRNIRKKLVAFLDDSVMTDRTAFLFFGSLTYKDPPRIGNCGNVEICIERNGFKKDHSPKTLVSFGVRCPPAHDPMEVSLKTEQLLIQYFAPGYGFVTHYPAAFCWDKVAHGIAYVPNYWDGFRDIDNNTYQRRLFRSADEREWCFRPERGWLREVYTINLINDRHLAAPFNGGTLGDYIATHGTLARNIHGSELHRWHVPNDIIDQVRNDLEPSGLILSSETEPVALPA